MRPIIRRSLQSGFTLAELVMVAALMVTLASVTLPVIKYTSKRTKEMELRQALRQMRQSIDEHKRYSDLGLIPVDLGTQGYPAELEVLVEGVEVVGQIDKKAKFLRRIPIDPITKSTETWQLVYEEIDPDNPPAETDESEDGQPGIIDIHSGSPLNSLNGTPYSEW